MGNSANYSCIFVIISFFFFFFNDTATTEIYTLSLHDALPISTPRCGRPGSPACAPPAPCRRSEEHTSELQSRVDLVCRLLLEKKKKNIKDHILLRKKENKNIYNRKANKY